MNKIVVLIMGKSGCGKSTLERNLINSFPSFKKVVSSTTRPKRPGEVHGTHYWFVSDEEYDNTDFIQTTEFAGHRYGSAVSEYQTKHMFPTLCVVPSSAKDFTSTLKKRFPTWWTFNVWFDISEERLIANMRKRGDTEEMIEKRISQDTLEDQFNESGLEPNFIVQDHMLDHNLHKKVAGDIILASHALEIHNTAKIKQN